MFADDVHLADRRTGGEQRLVDRLLVGQRQTGRGERHQGRATAGDEGDHQIVLRQPLHRRQNPPCGGFAIGVGHRRGGFQHDDLLRRHRMVVAGDNHARQIDIRPCRFEGGRHRGRRFAAADDHAAAFRLVGQEILQHHARIGCCHGSVKHLAQKQSCPRIIESHLVTPQDVTRLWRNPMRSAIYAELKEETDAMSTPEIDAATTLELEAAAFRTLVAHLRTRSDVQNIDMMNLAGFCRNCLSRWYREAAEARGIALADPDAREIVYGMPYKEWQAQNQKAASPEQQAKFAEAIKAHQ